MEINLSDVPFILACLSALLWIAYTAGDFFGWKRGKAEGKQELNNILNQINR